MADAAETSMSLSPIDNLKLSALPSAESPVTPEISAPMLEVHAPHEPIYTCKGFLVHIATIVIGLLIAVGLEQSVEYFHHSHQVAQLRRYGRGRSTGISSTSPPSVDAWKAAQQGGVLVYMPHAEVRRYTRINDGLEQLAKEIMNRRTAIYRASTYTISQPDASKLSPAQIDEQISLTSAAILAYTFSARSQLNMTRLDREFSMAPTNADVLTLTHREYNPESQKRNKEFLGKWIAIQKLFDEAREAD